MSTSTCEELKKNIRDVIQDPTHLEHLQFGISKFHAWKNN